LLKGDHLDYGIDFALHDADAGIEHEKFQDTAVVFTLAHACYRRVLEKNNYGKTRKSYWRTANSSFSSVVIGYSNNK